MTSKPAAKVRATAFAHLCFCSCQTRPVVALTATNMQVTRHCAPSTANKSQLWRQSVHRNVRACHVNATSHKVEEHDAGSQINRVAAGLLATAAAVSLVVLPPNAQAVSGGGGISAPISGQDFSNQDLRKRSFTKAIMRQTNFSNANLTGVSFFGGLAVGANFHGANLTNADLESGDFEDADFSDAILAGAFANNAQFKNANIRNTDWSEVILRKDVQKYLCKLPTAEGTNPVTGVDTRESLFCP